MSAREIPLSVKRKQAEASDPAVAVFVAANAGSGKTFVLAQRVIRLMLDGGSGGVDPSKILCITFTKAAAAEHGRARLRHAAKLDRARRCRRSTMRSHELGIAGNRRRQSVRVPGACSPRRWKLPAASRSRPSMLSAPECSSSSRSRPTWRRAFRCWRSASRMICLSARRSTRFWSRPPARRRHRLAARSKCAVAGRRRYVRSWRWCARPRSSAPSCRLDRRPPAVSTARSRNSLRTLGIAAEDDRRCGSRRRSSKGRICRCALGGAPRPCCGAGRPRMSRSADGLSAALAASGEARVERYFSVFLNSTKRSRARSHHLRARRPASSARETLSPSRRGSRR